MKEELMTIEEIHHFGCQVVFEQLKKDGYEIISVNTDLGVNPQIVAKKEEQQVFIIVRTDVYPNKGTLEKEVHFQMLEHASQHNATPYFASVGIANSSDKTNEEMSKPIRGAGFYISYQGLLLMTRSDRVKIWGEDGIKDIDDESI